MQPTLDPAVLDRLTELQDPDEPDIVKSLIDLFLVEGRERIDTMHKASAAGDAQARARAAHSLKGSAGTIGALHLQELCAAIEHGTGNVEDASAEFQRAADALRAIAAAR